MSTTFACSAGPLGSGASITFACEAHRRSRRELSGVSMNGTVLRIAGTMRIAARKAMWTWLSCERKCDTDTRANGALLAKEAGEKQRQRGDEKPHPTPKVLRGRG